MRQDCSNAVGFHDPAAAGRYGAAFFSFLAYFVRKLHEHKSSISRRHWLMLIRKPYSKGN
jgi:hypothetical protein